MAVREMLPEVAFVTGMGYSKAEAERVLAKCKAGTVEDRVAEALKRLGPDFKEEPDVVRTDPVAVPERRDVVEPVLPTSPQRQASRETERGTLRLVVGNRDEEPVAEDGGPLEWLIKQASWFWHTWNDPIIKAKTQERDRLLGPRSGLLQSVKRWVHLVERAEKSHVGDGAAMLREAEQLEAQIVTGILAANPAAKAVKRRTKR